MNHASTLPSETWLLRWGQVILAGAFVVATLLLTYLIWAAPDLVPFFPVLILAPVTAWVLFQRPLLNLFIVMCGFILVARPEEGIQVTELLYAMYYLGFLAHWAVVRLFMQKQHVIRNLEDQALVLFLVLITLSFPLTILYGGPMSGAVTEWMAWALLGLYFPIREAVESSRRGLLTALAGLAFVGFFVFFRNLLNFQEIIVNASAAWQVARGRVITNSALILIPSFMALALFLSASRKREMAQWFSAFMMFVAGLLLTQSRGYWLAFAFGAFIIFLIVRGRYRSRLVWSALISVLGSASVAYLVFPDVFILLASGMVNRLFSIGSAVSSDPSMVNRYLESYAALDHFWQNPILGHGMGTPFRFYDITWEYSMNRAFIHNGYVSLLFKFGLWGTVLVLFFFGAVFVRSMRGFRMLSQKMPLHGASALGVVGCLAAMAVASITSNPFYLKDTLFILGVVAGIGGGVWARSIRS